jgi:HD-GYP domain-containing protein (c-di-GMP phosphodiesterase class II)
LSIFKLSRNLNKTSDLDEILSLLVDATFEAFPSANFFAISLLPEDASDKEYSKMEALVARDRTPLTKGSPRPLLSKSLLAQVAESRESVLFVRDDTGANLSDSIINAWIMACLAAPLIGQKRLLGVMQTDTRGLGGLFGPEDLDLFTVVASYAAFAIEGLQLRERIYEMFEGIVRASVTAVDARDPSTSGHSLRVCQCYMLMADVMNEIDHGPYTDTYFTKEELRELRYAALLHDIGKIGVKESILVKAKRLYPDALNTIKTRFESIKACQILSLNRTFSESLLQNQTPVTQPELDQLEARAKALKANLDQQLNFILKANSNPTNNDETINSLEEIGNMTYTDPNGNSHPFLKQDELASLQIPRGTLTSEEWQDIKAHSALSRDYLNQIPWNDDLKKIPMIAGWHHEKLDGSGYPDGITGDEIPLAVRMLTICDIYDALTAADRPYRNALTPEKAGEILKFEAEKGQLDKELVEFFIVSVIPRWEKRKKSFMNDK